MSISKDHLIDQMQDSKLAEYFKISSEDLTLLDFQVSGEENNLGAAIILTCSPDSPPELLKRVGADDDLTIRLASDFFDNPY